MMTDLFFLLERRREYLSAWGFEAYRLHAPATGFTGCTFQDETVLQANFFGRNRFEMR
jgi:hypothetical protein